jgi:DNA-binding response OmpR family regulator
MVTDAGTVLAAPVVLQVGPYLLQLMPADVLAEATLRRAPSPPSNRVSVDAGLHVLFVDGRPVIEGMTGLEYRLAELLTAANGKLVPIKDLGDALWGAGAWDPYLLHNLVRRVRRKLEEKGLAAESLIVSVPGGGYHIV